MEHDLRSSSADLSAAENLQEDTGTTDRDKRERTRALHARWKHEDEEEQAQREKSEKEKQSKRNQNLAPHLASHPWRYIEAGERGKGVGAHARDES